MSKATVDAEVARVSAAMTPSWQGAELMWCPYCNQQADRPFHVHAVRVPADRECRITLDGPTGLPTWREEVVRTLPMSVARVLIENQEAVVHYAALIRASKEAK